MESLKYWRARYLNGGNSGAGSYGEMAQFKADTINEFIESHKDIVAVLDVGCGDGNQASLLKCTYYKGVDISKVAIDLCKKKFEDIDTMSFMNTRELDDFAQFDLVLSLDVVYHLLEEEVFESHMGTLFRHAGKYVIIYSSDTNRILPNQAGH